MTETSPYKVVADAVQKNRDKASCTSLYNLGQNTMHEGLIEYLLQAVERMRAANQHVVGDKEPLYQPPKPLVESKNYMDDVFELRDNRYKVDKINKKIQTAEELMGLLIDKKS